MSKTKCNNRLRLQASSASCSRSSALEEAAMRARVPRQQGGAAARLNAQTRRQPCNNVVHLSSSSSWPGRVVCVRGCWTWEEKEPPQEDVQEEDALLPACDDARSVQAGRQESKEASRRVLQRLTVAVSVSVWVVVVVVCIVLGAWWQSG